MRRIGSTALAAALSLVGVGCLDPLPNPPVDGGVVDEACLAQEGVDSGVLVTDCDPTEFKKLINAGRTCPLRHSLHPDIVLDEQKLNDFEILLARRFALSPTTSPRSNTPRRCAAR